MPVIQPASCATEDTSAWNDFLALRATELAFLNRRLLFTLWFPILILNLGLLESNYPHDTGILLIQITFFIKSLLLFPQYMSKKIFVFVQARAEGIATAFSVWIFGIFNVIIWISARKVNEAFERCSDLNATFHDEMPRIRSTENFTDIGTTFIQLSVAMTGDYCHDIHAFMALFSSVIFLFMFASVMLSFVLILRPARFHHTILMVVPPGGVFCGQLFATFAEWGARPLLYCIIGPFIVLTFVMLLWVPYNSGKLRFANFLHERRQSLKLRRAATKVALVEAQKEEIVLRLKDATAEIKKVMEEGKKVLAAYELRSADIEFASPARKLGEGSFGTVVWAVYRGTHEVAVKTMRVSKIMAPLHHPNLVRLFGGVWNEGADKLCIVLEFCGNGSLKTFLAEDSGTWEGLRFGLALGIAKGLRYLHHDLKEPLIHRDVKPDNILIGKGTVAKLADFGESTNFDTERAKKDADASGEDALTMTMVGTKLYCAPEILNRERYNNSVDTFSFALTLLCLAVGDIDYVSNVARKHPKCSHYNEGNRPPVPELLYEQCSALAALIEQMWDDDFRTRPLFTDIVPRLEACSSLCCSAAGILVPR